MSRRLVRRAQADAESGWEKAIEELSPGRRVPVLFSDEITVPMTCGVRKPCVLVPVAARDWSALRRHPVLLHELAHVERRDVLAQIAKQSVAALWWFQPLVWLLRGALRSESELACDAAALASRLLPSQYAGELLAIAQDIREPALVNAAGISMARRGDLETRLASILKPTRSRLGPARISLALILLIAIAVGSSTLTADTNSHSQHSGGVFMKRTALAALLASAGLSAATITGTVMDPRGAPLGGAKLTLANPDSGQKFEATSDNDGRFSLPSRRPAS